jgi:hypothetical protein
MEREFRKAAIRRAKLDLELDERIEGFCKPISIEHIEKSIERAKRISRELDAEIEERVKLKYPMPEPKRRSSMWKTFKETLGEGLGCLNLFGKIVLFPFILGIACLVAIRLETILDVLFLKKELQD